MGRSGGGVINKRLCSWRLQAVACFTHCLFFFSLVSAPKVGALKVYLMLWIGGQTHTYVTFVND